MGSSNRCSRALSRMPATTEALPAERFRDALQAAVETVGVGESRLCRLLANPRSPPRLLRRFAANIHNGATQFPGLLAALIACAPDHTARAVLMDNLLEEHGFRIVPGEGLVGVRCQCHTEWSAQFLRACGGDPRDVERTDAVLACTRIEAMLLAGHWLEAVAYLLIGQEATFGRACSELVAALRRRGLKDADIVFFSRHAVADQKHGEDALTLVTSRATSPERQLSVIEAAAAGARHWRSQYEMG